LAPHNRIIHESNEVQRDVTATEQNFSVRPDRRALSALRR
jgi:hypothetical protein